LHCFSLFHGKIVEKSFKRWYEGLTEKNIPEYLDKLLHSNGFGKRCPGALEEFILFLDKLLQFFENYSTRCFFATSILLFVDNTLHKYKIAFIDFSYPFKMEKGQKDENMIEGLKNLRDIMKKMKG